MASVKGSILIRKMMPYVNQYGLDRVQYVNKKLWKLTVADLQALTSDDIVAALNGGYVYLNGRILKIGKGE